MEIDLYVVGANIQLALDSNIVWDDEDDAVQYAFERSVDTGQIQQIFRVTYVQVRSTATWVGAQHAELGELG